MHSPFHVIENFISPLQCESISNALAVKFPNKDEKGQPLKYERLLPAEIAGNLSAEFSAAVPFLEKRFNAEVVDDPHMLYQQHWENAKQPAQPIGAAGWRYIRRKWTKISDIDLVGFLWLKDYQSTTPLDPRYEVYGGKLEFPAYNFSLTPVRGTMVLFPATPHFVFAISHIMFGVLDQVIFSTKMTVNGDHWQYDPTKFPGSYKDWFFTE